MTASTALEVLDCGLDDGTRIRGVHREIISGVGATRTLLAKESGSLCLFDRAAGVVYTLPTPVEGMYFDFFTTVTITSNAAKTITAAATQYILGTILGYTSTVTLEDGFEANGSSHTYISSNGSTTGGVIGDSYRLTAISTTQWVITGNIYCGTSTPATPFA